VSSESLDRFQAEYQTGKEAFDRGRYRQAVQHLQEATKRVNRNSRRGGEALMWLLNAYQAAGDSREAIALCRRLTRHPDFETRKQAKRLLYILEAPKLNTRPEWLIEIPDLSAMDETPSKVTQIAASAPKKKSKRKPPEAPPPVDLSQVNTKDNGFVWVAIVAIALILSGLVWFS
jgi:tetratricopeptide (TPR) repeat protein